MPPDPPASCCDAVPASPCRGICLMDPATRMCRVCRRTIAEIAGWYDASPAEKRTILARLATRRAAAAAAER